MALQDILKKIREGAVAETTKIDAEADAEIQKLKAASDETSKAEIKAFEAKTEKALQDVEVKTKSMARREGAQLLLQTKRQLIEDAKKQFLGYLIKSDDATYGKMIEKLFSQMKDASGRVFAPKSRLAVTKKHAPKDCTVFEDEKIRGGFLFRGVDSEVDNTFENLIFSEFGEAFTTFFADQLKLTK